MKKTLLAAAALVFVVASPAFAQSYAPDVGSGNLNSWPYTTNPDNPYADRARIGPYANGVVPYDGAYAFAPFDTYGADSYDYAPTPRTRHRGHR